MSVGAWDIETENWSHFVVGDIRYPDGSHFTSWDEDDFFDALVAHRGDLWGWNAGRFDDVWAASVARRRGMTATARMAGGRIVTLKVGNVTLRDGFALWPEKLADVAEVTPHRKLSTGLKCPGHPMLRFGRLYKYSDCGGYCRIRRRGMTRDERIKLAEYLCTDTEVTAGVIEWLESFAAAQGMVLKSTIGASAWATARDVFHVPKAEWKWSGDYRYARQGYYGGRTEVYRVAAPLVHRYDINSAYPAALENVAVPVGEYRTVDGRAARAAFNAGRPGIYTATVTVPDVHVPTLPARGAQRLLWCTGKIRDTWTRDELQAAIDDGATLHDVSEAMIWEREERILAPFMSHFANLRLSLGKKSPAGRFLKWFINSPTGKLAMRPEGERCIVGPDLDDIRVCPANYPCLGFHGHEAGCCKHRCLGTCGAWECIGQNVWCAPEYRIADCAHVQWAATLTATTRIELRRQLASGDPVYCDTDSVYSVVPLSRNVGPHLGQFNYEGPAAEWRARAPKAYQYIDAETGAYHVKSKGVPGLTGFDWEKWAAGEAIEQNRGVWGIKGGARRGDIFARRETSRAARSTMDVMGTRIVLPDGGTRPMSLTEWRKRESEGKK